MATKVIMPKLGLNMKEGLIVEWLVKDGAEVKKGQALFSVETEKVVNEIESDADGILRHVVKAGDFVPVAGVVAYIIQPGEVMPTKPEVKISERNETQKADEEKSEIKLSGSGYKKILASPKAKQRAKELGVDLDKISVNSADRRISVEDIENFATQPSSREKSVKVNGIREVIARRMRESSQETASVTLHAEADASELLVFREKINQDRNESNKISLNAIFIKISADVLKTHVELNAKYLQNEIFINKDVNIGLAMDTENGLVVPVVKNVDQLSLEEVNQAIAELKNRITNSKYSHEDLSDGTFTITNLGVYGIEYFTPLINLPNMAILGIGSINKKPVVKEGQVVVRDRVSLSLTFDHRWIDGAPAARFLQKFIELLENIDLGK